MSDFQVYSSFRNVAIRASNAVGCVKGISRRFFALRPDSMAMASPRKKRLPKGSSIGPLSDTIRLVSDIERSVVDPELTFLKVIVSSRFRNSLGCLAVGDHAPVIINIARMAMKTELTIDQLLQIPLLQPSASDALRSILLKARRSFETI